MVEIVAIVAILGIMVSVGIIMLKGTRGSVKASKLNSELRSLNAAVSAFRGLGGDLSSASTPEQVVALLKTTLSEEDARRVPGYSGAMLDQRMVPVPQTVAEAASDQARLYWNSSTKTFEWATSGPVGGIKEFRMEDLPSMAKPPEMAREKGYEYSDAGWIWDYDKPASESLASSVGVLKGSTPAPVGFIPVSLDPGSTPAGQTPATPPSEIPPSQIPTQGMRPDAKPITKPDTLTCFAKQPATINVLYNDKDPDGGRLRIIGAGKPEHGRWRTTPTGSCTYTPDGKFEGTVLCTYTVIDNEGNTADGVCRVRCIAENKEPIAGADSYRKYATLGAAHINWFPSEPHKDNWQYPLEMNVLANDRDPEGKAIKITSVRNVTNQYPIQFTYTDNKITVEGIYTSNGGIRKKLPTEDKWIHFFGLDRFPAARNIKDDPTTNGPHPTEGRLRTINERLARLGPEKFAYTVTDADGKESVGEASILFQTYAHRSPLAIDLDGDGEITRIDRRTTFDFDGNGQLETVAQWFGHTDGILIRLPKAGEVFSGLNLFGDQMGAYPDGFAKLSLLDSDDDAQISGAELDGLAIWIDRNGDAKFTADEATSLEAAGIISLGTQHEQFIGSAWDTAGNQVHFEDVWFPAL